MDGYCDNEEVLANGDTCDSFYLSKAASGIATISGSIFAIPPLIVISVIFRSQQRFTSIYHRIIFVISTFDVLTCISVALATIPMPTGVIYPYDSFVGGAYGTTTTCAVQSFVFITSFHGSGIYFTGLSVFYLCVLRYSVRDLIMRKYVEPMIHFFGLGGPLLMGIIFLAFGLLNPSPYEAWCGVAVYPWDCSKFDTVDCIRGESVAETYVTAAITVAAVLMLLCFVIIAFCMGLIIHSFVCGAKIEGPIGDTELEDADCAEKDETNNDVKKSEESVQYSSKKLTVIKEKEITNNERDCDSIPQQQQQQQSTLEEGRDNVLITEASVRSAIVQQALMYIGAFLLIRICRFFALVSGSSINQGFRLLSTPLQSGVNAMIFLYHKVHNKRRLNPSLTFRMALRSVILDPFPTTDIKLTGLSVISKDKRLNRAQPSVENEVYYKEEGVDDASKDMHLSYRVSAEASRMLDLEFEGFSSRYSGSRAQNNDIGSRMSHGFSGNSASNSRSEMFSTGGSKLSYDDTRDVNFQDDTGLSYNSSTKGSRGASKF